MTRGERWLARMAVLAAVLGAFWWYSFLWLRRDTFLLPFAMAAAVFAAGVWGWLMRLRRDGTARRAALVERELWRGTLPGGGREPLPRPDDERVV